MPSLANDRPDLKYATCPAVLEFEQLALRQMTDVDVDAVARFLPPRTPTPAFERRLGPGGQFTWVVRGKHDDTVDAIIAVLRWRMLPGGHVEITAFHVAPGKYRALGLEAWLIRKLKDWAGPGKQIRTVIPEMDVRGARNLLSLGFVRERLDSFYFAGATAQVDGRVFRFDPEYVEPSEDDPQQPYQEEQRVPVKHEMMHASELAAVLEAATIARGQEGRAAIEEIIDRPARPGIDGPHIAITKDGDDIVSFIVFSLDRANHAVHIELAVFAAGPREDAHGLIEFLHRKALGDLYEFLDIDLATFVGDNEPFLRFGFQPDETRAGERLTYEVGR